MMSIGKIAFIAGLVISVLLAFVAIPYAAIILLVLGLLIGFLNVSDAEASAFLLAAIALISTNAAVSIIDVPFVGGVLIVILANIGTLMTPAVLVVAIKSLLTTAKN